MEKLLFCQAYVESIQTSDKYSLNSLRNHPSPHCQHMCLGGESVSSPDLKLMTWRKLVSSSWSSDPRIDSGLGGNPTRATETQHNFFSDC